MKRINAMKRVNAMKRAYAMFGVLKIIETVVDLCSSALCVCTLAQ